MSRHTERGETKATRKQPATARSDRIRELEEWEWTVSPEATLDLDDDADPGDTLDTVLDALEADSRARGVGACGYNTTSRRLSSTFQVHLDPADQPTIADAAEAGRIILADALDTARVDATVDAVSAVRGGDADQLP